MKRIYFLKDLAFVAEIFYTASPTLHRMARKENHQVVEVDFEIPGQTPCLWGAIYRGRVVEIQNPLQAAFVDIGLPHPGLLPLREGKLPPVKQGEAVLVQISRTENPLEAKGVRLTRMITLSLGYLLYTPFRPGLSLSKKLQDREGFKALLPLQSEEGVVVRHGASPDSHLPDLLVQLRQEWTLIHQNLTQEPPVCVRPPMPLLTRLLRSLTPSDRFIVDDRKIALLTQGRVIFSPEKAFDEDCEDAWDSLSSCEIPLKQGGNLMIEETRACVVIDVNSQGALKHPLSFNRLAIQEALRQIRLRNLGGKIIIDLIDTPQALPPLLQGIQVPSDVEIFGLSPLHLLEMIRRRTRLSLPQRLKFGVN
jgi:Rne/Rng family ribonuclease